MAKIDELIEGYFEGTLTEEEETRLKVFLASEEGRGPEYDEVRAVMSFFAVGRKDRAVRRRPVAVWPRIAAIAASLAIIVTIGVNIYNKENICVSFVGGQKVTDKEFVMNDVDNILADLLSDRVDMEEQLVNIFGE